jgi:hypothetical protein
MTEQTCEKFRELAPELALGILPGDDRSAAIAHADRCPCCREHLVEMTAVNDGLLALIPRHEPPAGFETRVMNRLRPGRSGPQRRVLAAAAAVLLAVVVGMGGWAIGAQSLRVVPEPPDVVAEPHLMNGTLAAEHGEAGQVFVYSGTPPWIYMAVDIEYFSGTVSCQLQRVDGSVITIGQLELTNGYGYWGGPISLDPSTVTGAHLAAPDGTVIASARLA